MPLTPRTEEPSVTTYEVVLPRSQVRILVSPQDRRWLLTDDAGRGSLDLATDGRLTPLDPFAAAGSLVSWQFLVGRTLFRIGLDTTPRRPTDLTLIGLVGDDGLVPVVEADGEPRRVEVLGGRIWYAEWHGTPGVVVAWYGSGRRDRVDLRRRLHYRPTPPQPTVRWGSVTARA